MEAFAFAQQAADQAEAQNAITLLLAAINSGLISIADANNLTTTHIGEIGVLDTPEEVRDYVFFVLHETPEQRAARLAQQEEQLRLVREQVRREVQERTDARANTFRGVANGVANGDAMNTGGKRRRRRTRKARRYF